MTGWNWQTSTCVRKGANAGTAITLQLLGRVNAQLSDGSAGTHELGESTQFFSASSALCASAFGSRVSGGGVPVSSILQAGVDGRPHVLTSTVVLPPVVVDELPPGGAVGVVG